ncbi:hypothetical protein MTO96_040827 [Rhipicephalus appendiculatus]
MQVIPDSSRPVLVWIHGGGFTYGSANQALYNGTVLTALTDVLVVSINYRLSILGFMNAYSPEGTGERRSLRPGHGAQSSSASGNKSAEELVVAAAESVSPKVIPFFPTYHDAFIPRDPMAAIKRGFFSPVEVITGVTVDEAALILKYPAVPDLVAENLVSWHPAELANALQARLSVIWKQDTPEVLRMYTEDAPKGDNNALRRQYVDFTSDRVFNCPLRFFAEKHSDRGGKVFAYLFAQKSPMDSLPDWMGPPHSSDLSFVFGEWYAVDPASRDGRMSEAFMRMVAAFAHNGVPELPNGQEWTPYTRSSPVMLVMDDGHFNESHGFRTSHCERWRPLF